MTLYDFRYLLVEDSQKVKIYDISGDADIIFEGYFDELPEEYEDYEISSIDNVDGDTDYIGINIDTED